MTGNLLNIIGCIPFWAKCTPPSDQEDPQIENCPDCKKPMWVSRKKRHLRNTNNYATVCMPCALVMASLRGIDKNEIGLFDLAEEGNFNIASSQHTK